MRNEELAPWELKIYREYGKRITLETVIDRWRYQNYLELLRKVLSKQNFN